MVKTIATKSVRLLVAAVLALYMCVPLSAYAADLSTEDSTVEAKSVEGYVTASTTPASQAAPEILGLTDVDELTNSSPSIDDTTNSLKYIFFGTDEYNENPNPYFYNTIYDTDGVQTVYNSDMRWLGQNSIASNPVRALAPYGTGDDTDDLVWEQLPDVIVGNQIDKAGTTVTYLEDEYAPAVEAALGLESGSYQPIAVEYTLNSMADIVDKTYGIAEAGEQVVENSDGAKQLRYGSAVDIATNYEKYVKGTQGYILQALDEGTVEEKNVVVVEDYADDQFTLTKTPSSWATGTRFLEITTLVADNLADDLEGDDAATVTRDELAAMDVDLIILTSDVSDTEMGDLATKTYWASSNIAGAIYKVDANSVEIATNYGRILGCLYDEILDQSDLVAYYYDTFYHIKDSMLATAIDQAMDGVRNWAVQDGSGSELLVWGEEDVADYSQDEVQAILDAGVAYIYSLGEEADELVQLTDYIEVNGIDISDATVSFSIADGAASVSAVLSGTTLVEGTDYTVAYTNEAGETVTTLTDASTYTATLTGTGTATDGYYGTATATYTVEAVADTDSGTTDTDSSDEVSGGSSGTSGTTATSSTPKKQTLKVTKTATKTVKYSKLKKKARTVKVIKKVSGAKTKLSYSKVKVKKNGKKASSKVAKKIVVNSKTGKVKLKKGLAKGTYKVTIKVKAKKTAKYKKATKNVTVKIKVK